MIEIIDLLKPKNGGSFKLIEAIDVSVNGYTSLADCVAHMATTAMIEAINAALSGKQDKLTTAQLTAVNSGITSELVAQIGTNTTAIAGKADAADLATATTSLQAQIDNIVSGSTEDAEVINARVGADGTSYGTLKARLDAEDSFNIDNTKQVNNNVDALCDVIGVFLPKSKTVTLVTNSKRFLNVGNLKNGKTYTFTFTINKAAAQPVYFGIKNDAGSLASRNIAAGLTSHTYSYTADADYNDVYVSVTLYEELTVSVAVTATGSDKDKVSQNAEDIEDIQADNASTANDIKELIDIVGAKFIPKSITKKADGSKNHFFEVGNLYYNATYTFVYSISEAVAHPVYFTLQTSEKTITTYNIAAGSTTQTLTFTADDFYEDAYISIIAYDAVTITINVTATGYDNDQVTKNKNNIAAMQLSLNALETAFDDITVDVSDYTDVTSEATNHDNEFVSWFSLTPTEAAGWQYLTLEVTAGETYQVYSYGGSNARNWILAVDGEIVDYCKESSQAERTVEVTITQSGILYVNNNKSNATAAIKLKNLKTGIDGEQVYLDSEPIDERLARSNTLYKKILCCCGDSITYGDDMDQEGFTNNPDIDIYQWSSSDWNKLTSNVRMTWGYQIASRNNMTFYNGGVNGSTMQGLSDRNGFSLANGRYTQLPNNIDYLVIFFGWNDTAYGTLGTLSDSTNESYYGGYNVVIPYLQNKYPYTKICLVVPFGCDTGHRNAIRELCNKWGLACFDMYGAGTPLYYGKEADVGVDAAVVTANRAKYQANGAHPNYKGHKQIADMLENFLRGI